MPRVRLNVWIRVNETPERKGSDDMASVAITLHEDAGFCNAVRKSLLDDVKSWAPSRVTFRLNTSCQTDEFLAHRIGLIPFHRCQAHGLGTLHLRASGPTIVRAGHFTGSAFEPVHPEIEIMMLGEGQEFDLDVEFDECIASTHARYSPCAAVGMEKIGDKQHRITFEVLGPKTAHELYHEALDALEARVDAALQSLAHQPETPPPSMC